MQILDVWEAKFAATIGPIVLVASDGDAVRRQFFHEFTTHHTSDMLRGFKLMDRTTSAGGVVQCFDMKHNLKRLRARDISKKGVTISEEGLALNCDSYRELFRWYDETPDGMYKSFFDVDDKWVYSCV